MNEMSTRSYLVQKDRLLFRIELKLIGKLAKNDKKQYVRGYLIAASVALHRTDTFVHRTFGLFSYSAG
jgi:hypothetical protein